ncbi:hypothetical protein [Gemmata massiliana]|uniref:hypothetical protein n=1 Tax=Gemmata massiliana TaxID=1210884 RepID=UPI0013A6C171|nr:hypothetical protein [Gemmata massiliana]
MAVTVVVLIAISGILLSRAGVGRMLNLRQQEASQSSGSADARVPPESPARLGDIQVRITKVTVGKIPVKALGMNAVSEDVLLAVTLELMNVNPTKKMEYQSWSGTGSFIDRGDVTLTDDFGNRYNRITFGLGTQPVGALKRTESIYPNAVLNDVVVFEVPIAQATHLSLELPAQNFGDKGSLRFRIPMDFVTRVQK